MGADAQIVYVLNSGQIVYKQNSGVDTPNTANHLFSICSKQQSRIPDKCFAHIQNSELRLSPVLHIIKTVFHSGEGQVVYILIIPSAAPSNSI